MTAVTQGTTSSITLQYAANISFSLDPSEVVFVVILVSGKTVYGSRINVSETIGPFPFGAVVSITAERGTIDYSLSAYSVPATPTQPTPRTSITSRMLTSSFGGGNTNGAPGWTSHVRQIADAPFNFVRLILPNMESAALTNVTAAVAVSTSTASNITPTTGTWVSVTVGASAAFTLPAQISATEPSYTLSDWIALDSVARSDGGALPVVMARMFVPSSNATFSFCGVNSGFDSVAGNHGQWQSRQLLDGITTPANFTQTSEGGTVSFTGIQCRGLSAGMMGIAFGDSLTVGFRGTISQHGWTQQTAEALQDAGYPVSIINAGWTGQTTTQYLARAKTMIALLKPSFAIYAVFSPNDSGAGTITATTISTALQNAAQFLDTCYANNVIPILTTPVPNNSNNSAGDVLRKALRDQINAMSPRIDVIDFDSVLSDQNNPAQFIAGTFFDITHPNDAGYALMTQIAIPTIRRVISR